MRARQPIVFFALLLAASAARATPSISGISGNASYGSDLTISGTGFGSKPNQAKTLMYANFEFDVNPSSWGAVTSWTDPANEQRATTTCEEGAGCLGETAGWDETSSPNKVTAAVDLGSPIAASGKVYQSWDWQSDAQDVGVTANFKSYRRWANSFLFNDQYGAQQCDGGYKDFNENDDGISPTDSRVSNFTDRFIPNHSAFTQAIIQEQENSSAGTADGIFIRSLDGAQQTNWTNWLSFTAADLGNGRFQLYYPVHMEFTSGGSCSPNPTISVPINDGSHPHYVRYDNLIVENSWCVVWFSTSASESAGVKRFYCPVKSWSGTSIVVVMVNKKVAAGGHCYFHVMENGGTFNSTGFDVVSQQNIGNPAPTIGSSEVSPSVAYAPDGLTLAGSPVTLTVTGTGFLSGMTGDIDGVSCLTPNVGSSTSFTCTVPPSSAGFHTVRVTNTDSQSASISNGIQYVARPVTSAFPWRP